MPFSDKQIRDLLSWKEKILDKIESHNKEIEQLESELNLLDEIIKGSSFTKASNLGFSKPEKKIDSKTIPILQGNDGKKIADAIVTNEQVSIILDNEIALNEDVPPFKSFFINRIIGEMKKKDMESLGNDENSEESVINCVLKNNGKDLREIIIKNYREKERVNEIINTATWSLTRMIENAAK